MEYLIDFNNVKNPRLAFNIAGAYAEFKDKPKMLVWIGKARQMGKPKGQFETDSSFIFYRNVPDFIEAIK